MGLPGGVGSRGPNSRACSCQQPTAPASTQPLNLRVHTCLLAWFWGLKVCLAATKLAKNAGGRAAQGIGTAPWSRRRGSCCAARPAGSWVQHERVHAPQPAGPAGECGMPPGCTPRGAGHAARGRKGPGPCCLVSVAWHRAVRRVGQGRAARGRHTGPGPCCLGTSARAAGGCLSAARRSQHPAARLLRRPSCSR